MKPKELRIGNLLNYPKYYRDGGDKIWNVRELSLDSPLIGLTDGRYQTKVAFKELVPIPIIAELLIELGFEKSGNDYAIKIQKDDKLGNTDYWISVDLGIDNQTNKIGVQILSQEGCYYTTKHQYVHELQNLYFAFTGEELTLKQ